MTPSPEWEARQARIKEQQEERAKAARRERRKELAVKVGTTIVGFIIALVAVTLVFQLLVWNLGIVGLLTALGASVSKIGFWTAFGGLFAWAAVGSLIHGGRAATAAPVVNNIAARRG